MDLLQLSEAAPQIAIAIAIIAAAVLLVRVIMGYIRKAPSSGKRSQEAALIEVVRELIGKIDRGEPVASCKPAQVIECGERFDAIEEKQESHAAGQRKLFRAMHKLDRGQREIYDHLTNGTENLTTPPVSHDIDDEPTGDSLR